jgi:hypothetical protein
VSDAPGRLDCGGPLRFDAVNPDFLLLPHLRLRPPGFLLVTSTSR